MNQPFNDFTEGWLRNLVGSLAIKNSTGRRKKLTGRRSRSLYDTHQRSEYRKGVGGSGGEEAGGLEEKAYFLQHTHRHTDIPGSASYVLNPVGRNSQAPPQSPRGLNKENTITEPVLHTEWRCSDTEQRGGRHTAREQQKRAVNPGGQVPGRRPETPVLQS